VFCRILDCRRIPLRKFSCEPSMAADVLERP
jgi:hypothetical protein